MSTRNFKTSQYARAEQLIKLGQIFNGDPGGGVFKKKAYPFVLQNSINNLYAPVASDILDYFEQNKVGWWNGTLTNHTLSSQVACLNHLFPIRNDKSIVLKLIKNINPEIIDVLIIESDKFAPAYIQFEAVSDTDHLNEKFTTRGSKCTSIDALILGVNKDGRRILFPIEWKYVEAYGNENKGVGKPGKTRSIRYTHLINQSTQLKSVLHSTYYFEPFYQLMRQTLWAEQMILNKSSETVKADDFVHIHIIPKANNDLLNKLYPCSGKDMESTWRSSIIEQHKYILVDPKTLLSPISSKLDSSFYDYLSKRYW